MLFMIDNSSSMTDAQNRLLQTFPGIMNVLKELPGGLPDLRVAVISQDMGAGTGINDCNGFGNNAVFQYTAHAPCANTTLQGGSNLHHRLRRTKNYTAPDISDVFTCIAALGQGGCGLEQPLLSISRALGADGFDPPAENQGFLRDNADLAIVMITNEDDCSAQQGADSDAVWNQPQHAGGDVRSRVELSLQRVRPPVQRRGASALCAHRIGHRPRAAAELCVERSVAVPDARRDAGVADQVAEEQSEQSDTGLRAGGRCDAIRGSLGPGARSPTRGPGRSSSRRVAPTPPA